MTWSEGRKDIEYVVDWNANIEELGQNLFDGSPDFLSVFVQFVLIVVSSKKR